MIPDKEYKSCTSSCCSCLQPPVTFYLLRPNIFWGILFSNILRLYSSCDIERSSFRPYKWAGKFNSCVYCTLFYVRNGKRVYLQCGNRHSQVTVFVSFSVPGDSEGGGGLLALRLPSKKPSFARVWTFTLSIVYSNSNQNRRYWRHCKLLFRTVGIYILLPTESRTDG
jgi:hypothetical protein